jgi:hypothetical protein
LKNAVRLIPISKRLRCHKYVYISTFLVFHVNSMR